MKLGFIYVHICKANNKAYVGQTRRKDPKTRWGSNGHRYSQQKKFWRAIKKYGWDSFEHIILEQVPVEVLNESEDLWISIFDSVKNGYNCETTNPHYGYVNKYTYHLNSGCWKKGHKTWNKKPIICVETGEIFESASSVLGRHAKEVIEKQWCSHGYHWKWAKEGN